MTINTGDFVHTTLAHANNTYEVKKVGEGWIFVDDNTVMGWSIPTDTATVHEYCGNKWCNACHYATYDVKTTDLQIYVRKTGERFVTPYDKLIEALGKVHSGETVAEIVKGVNPEDTDVINALQFFADRINPNVTVK